tara:strand:- start:461 stop:823 length:363 start_codon:yes stop_codon:yes gene_type:complete
MTQKTALHDQIGANLAALDAVPGFSAERLWLTVYLSGHPDELRLVAEALSAEGWRNTGDWESAFLYPKVEVERTAPSIVAVARRVQTLCELHAVDLLNIDADTSCDVQTSRFVTLYLSHR